MRSTAAVSLKLRAFCSRSVSETRQSCSVINAFCTTRRAILPSIFSAVKPGVPFSTRKPFTWLSASSRAQMTVTSAKVALPIHFFWPLSTQLSPSRRGVVVRPPAAPEPTSGSVSPNAPIFHPVHDGQPALLLVFRPTQVDGAHRQSTMHAEEGRDGGVHAR